MFGCALQHRDDRRDMRPDARTVDEKGRVRRRPITIVGRDRACEAAARRGTRAGGRIDLGSIKKSFENCKSAVLAVKRSAGDNIQPALARRSRGRPARRWVVSRLVG